MRGQQVVQAKAAEYRLEGEVMVEVDLFDLLELWLRELRTVGRDVNLVAIVILSRGKFGLSRCVTRYLVAMAASDLMVVVTDVILNRINNIYFPFSFMFYTPVCSLRMALLASANESSVWLTVGFTFDRFVAISCQKLKTRYCTERIATIVTGTISVLSCLQGIPWYFIFIPGAIVNSIPLYCIEKPSFYTSPLWRGFEWFVRVLTPLLVIGLIFLFNALTVRSIVIASRARRRLRGGGNAAEKQSDPEMMNRRRSIILLFTISTSFVLLWLTSVVYFLKWPITNFFNHQEADGSNVPYIIQECGFMLQILSSCTNTCIYAATQSKFRAELTNGIKYPFKSIVKMFK
ncbi:probable G-protein coupled receptor 139 [Callorhinchus milii]|uniref:probable G-protein coupled receptor 139 n=1 Tax=Callorhinchus milii TaxID=7868 RepID=UPI001C3F7C42|nr:probable G-protein coupled receptor 139 [Callorhinchus milii]